MFRNVRRKLCLEDDTNSTFLNDLSDLPSSSSSPRKNALQQKIRFDNIKLKKYRHRLKVLQEKIKKTKNIQFNIIPYLAFLSSVAQTFVLMQIRGNRRKNWSQREKKFAISFFYKSASAYSFLRQKGVILPAPSSIRKWIALNEFKTGIDENLKQHLKMKCATFTKNEKKCVLAFDEINIKECLEFNKKLDLLEGFEDYGPLGRTAKQATHALVFSIRGLYTNWKTPVSYFFSRNSVNQYKLKDLIQYICKEIQNMGFYPKALVCDQGSNNRGALKLLGVTTEYPYFTSKNKKIYAIFDAPHLFKSVRNNLLSGIFKLDQQIINFDIIKATFQFDNASKTARALPKISERHINPNCFEKMSCSLALQVFSKTMAAAIRTCVETKLVNKKEGSDTAEFVLTLNNLFDSLNSKRLFDKNPFQSGLSDNNLAVIDILTKGKIIFSQLVKISKNKNITSRPPCFEGMVQTINGVMALFEDEKKDGNSFILTNRLNQDFLENFFSIIRQRGGWNLNPSAKSFRLAFRIQMITNLFKPSILSNCEDDSDVQIIIPLHAQQKNYPDLSKPHKTFQHSSNKNALESSDDSPATDDDDMNDNYVDPNNALENCAVTYYAGYLVRKTIDKFNCDNCRSSLQNNNDIELTDENEIFLLNKNYGKCGRIALVVPTPEIRAIINRCSLLFNKYFSIYKSQEFVCKKIRNRICTKINSWLGDNSKPCYEHRMFMVSHLTSTNLFKYCKWLRKTSKKREQKIKNLRNE